MDIEENTGLLKNEQLGLVNEQTEKVCQESGELPMVDGIDWNYGRMHLSDNELLLNTVVNFYKTLETEADTLQQFYLECKTNSDMLAQYRIKVHSMKSSANLIGATVLGGMAKMLENAARDADIKIIESLHDIFIQEWRSYKEKLQECVAKRISGEQSNREAIEAIEDYSVIVDYLETLRAAAEEMDIDTMDEVMEKLESYQYPDNIQSNIEQLSICITNMDDAQAMILIDEIMNQVKIK